MKQIGFLFDLDGTLVDSTQAVMNSWITMANEAGIPLEALAGHHGIPAAQTIRNVMPDREEAEIQKWIRRVTDLAIARTRAGKIPMPANSVTFDQVTRGKPFPEPFILGADRLGLPTDQCWAIEDAPGGVTSAKEAGCTVAGVLTTHTREELPHADHHLDHLNQLLGKAGL